MLELYALVYLVVFGTTVWVACDSKAMQVTTDGRPYHRWNGALAWVFCCVMIWIVAFPYYLSCRSATLRQGVAPTDPLTKGDRQRTPLFLCGALAVALGVIALSCWALAQQY